MITKQSKIMKTKIILDIPKGKSIKDCHLSKATVQELIEHFK